MDQSINTAWCMSSILMAWIAWERSRVGTQKTGSWVVIGLALVHLASVAAGYEKVALLANSAMLLVGLLLILSEKRWRLKNRIE